MPRENYNLQVKGKGQTSFSPGESLLEIARRVFPDSWEEIMSAQLDGEIVDLHTQVEKSHSKVHFFSFKHPEGRRTYIRTLIFVVTFVLEQIFPGKRVKVLHSIGDGLSCRIEEKPNLTPEELAQMEQKLNEIVSANRPLSKEITNWEKAINIYQKMGRQDLVRLFRYWRTPAITLYQLDNFYDYCYGPLCPSTGYLKKFNFVLVPPNFIIQFPQSSKPDQIPPYIFQPKLFNTFQEAAHWATIMEIEDVGELNQAIVQRKEREIISIAEALHEKKIAQIADTITQKKGSVQVVTIAGPSSSGKTTFTRRLYTQLRVNGWKPITISLDDYFLSRQKLRTKADFDYERPEALDLNLFEQHIQALIEGKEVELPRYNFTTGMREKQGVKTQLESEGIILVEGLHALNPKLLPHIAPEKKFKIYISAITQINVDDHNRISTTDSRLIRRLVRDYQFRGSTPEQVFEMWPQVRAGEEKFIFPFQEEAEVMFNSSLIYELSILRDYCEPLLRGITPENKHYLEAYRLYAFLHHLLPLQPSLVPTNSILREFIGSG